MEKKIIVVDKNFGKDNKIENPLALFPSFNYQPSWALEFKEHTKQHHAIVKIKEDLASFFSREVYSPALGYKSFACERLFLNYGTLIIYVLSDRLLRLNKLAEEHPLKDLCVPKVSFKYNREWTFGYLYYKKVENDPIYNQWIINRLLPELERKDFGEYCELPKNEYSEFYRVKENFLFRISRNIKESTFLLKLRKYLLDLFPRLILKFATVFNTIPIDGKNVVFLSMKKHLSVFFWPFGNLAPLESIEFKVLPSKKVTKITREDFLQHRKYVAKSFKSLLIDCQGKINLPESSFDSLVDILTEHLPIFTTEQAEVYCEKYLKEFKKYKGSFFIADGTGANTLKSLRMFACRELSIPVVGTQHSGWGGYLENGPLVSEILSEGADDYVTYGWKNKTPGEASWINQAISLPGPLLSELENISEKNRFSATSNNRVLISLGFIYRFPAIYNSFLRLDTLNDYVFILEEVFSSLSKAGWNITLSLYNSEVEKFFDSKIKEWKQNKKFNIDFLPDNNIKLRDYMQLDTFDSMYDAIIWDMPAGGFSESIALGKKTFSLFNEDIIKCTEASKPFIKNLKEQGIFFSDGSEISNSLNNMMRKPGWYLEKERVESITKFKQQYFKTSNSWEQEWKIFLKEYSIQKRET